MNQADPDPPAILSISVVEPGDRSGPARPSTTSAESDVRLVRALIGMSGGREVDGPFGDVCLRFDVWPDAMAGALALASQLPRLPTELAGIKVRMGLDLITGASEATVAGRAAAMARSAEPGDIRLGRRLANLVGSTPPDRFAVRPVAPGTASGRGTHRLVPARDVVPNNLDEAGTSFVAREAEIADLRRLLDTRRSITITGPPGVGKSRLALEVASRLLGRFEDGAWFIELAPIADPASVMSAVAGALGVTVPTGITPESAVIAYLESRRMLLVLDNFEHVMAARKAVASLAAAAPGLHVLVTSQAPLGFPGEHELVLGPLGGPASQGTFAGSAAVDLFAQRASMAQPGLRLDLALVGEVCRRVDGLPLAIELAAAHTRWLGLSAILERLDARLEVQSEDKGQPARHRSLRAAIGWSYDLLDPAAQRSFRRASVFRGGWTAEAAVDVCGGGEGADDAVLGSLATLQQSSLLRVGEPSATPRSTMLETLRQFAAERLADAGETEAVRRRHAAHFLALALEIGPGLTGPHQGAALDRLAIEHDNIRAALTCLLETDPVGTIRLSAAIWRFWQMRGHLEEGRRWIESALLEAGDQSSAEDQAVGRAAAGGLAYWRGDLTETERQYRTVVSLRRALGDDVALADALFDLAFVFDPSLRPPPEDPERTVAGIGIAEEAHALYVRANHASGIAKSEWLIGSVMLGRDLARAIVLLSSSVERFRAIGDPFGLGWALHSYGLMLLRSSDSGAAQAAFAEAMGLFAAASDSSAIALLLADLAEVAKVEGDALRVARLEGAASAMRTATQAALVVANAPWLNGDAVPRGLIDPADLESAWAEGRALSQGEAIAYALRSPATNVLEAGLRVTALGRFAAERSGAAIADWGGPKAGSRHALAIFAFLMDRGERGVTKDEFVEVLWPDAEVEQGDLNFHRTLGGLRSTLAGPAARSSRAEVVFDNGRYRLAGSVVSWLDVAEFQQRLSNAAEATDDLSAIRGLEAARMLYRGDYLDDCPLYGDSAYVEERRGFLRGRLIDALVDLGRRYEARQDTTLASARFREALERSDGDCPAASLGLERLGVAPT